METIAVTSSIGERAEVAELRAQLAWCSELIRGIEGIIAGFLKADGSDSGAVEGGGGRLVEVGSGSDVIGLLIEEVARERRQSAADLRKAESDVASAYECLFAIQELIRNS